MQPNEQFLERYGRATQDLALINRTWEKPDIADISFLFCQDVRQCLHDLLECFLLLREQPAGGTETTAELVRRCTELDARFSKLDLRWICCRDTTLETGSNVFCTSPSQTKICIWIANGVRKLVEEDLSKINAVNTTQPASGSSGMPG